MSVVCVQVTCGSVIKLQHANTGVNLHSHEISYGSGSGQQSVTGYTGGDDANDYWAVKGIEVLHPGGKQLSGGFIWLSSVFGQHFRKHLSVSFPVA